MRALQLRQLRNRKQSRSAQTLNPPPPRPCVLAGRVNISEVSPLPVNLTLNGAPVTGNLPLLRPLVKVFGSKIAELDGTPSSSAYDVNAAQDEATWISKYLVLPASYAGEPLSLEVSDQLQEGYYNGAGGAVRV